MKKSQTGIWIGEKDLNHDPAFIKQAQSGEGRSSLVEAIGEDNALAEKEGGRRDFLKFLGFGLGAATMAASCDIPVKRAMPYVVKPDDIVPGVATYYASSYVKGGDYCSILVKTREGRPIKIEGNALSGVTYGGTSARAQASVLELYDVNRLKRPAIKDAEGNVAEDNSWNAIDSTVKRALSSARGIRVVTNTILSPTAKRALAEFTAKYPAAQVVTYDPVSSAAMLDANQQSFGDRVIPNYKFDKADLIVSFNADFLGSWISPVEYAHDYAKKRKITKVSGAKMSRHVQVESHMSMTGSNADNRIMVKPSEQSAAVAYLYNEVVGGNVNGGKINGKAQAAIRTVAKQLTAARGKSIVVSGNNNVGEQLLVNAINSHLGNIGSTVDFNNASLQRQGSDQAVEGMINDIKRGNVDVVIFNDANPVYDYRGGARLADALSKVKTKVAMSYGPSETTALCNIIAPINHTLESWGDAEPKRGHLSLIQPTIKPLFETRQAELSILAWAGSPNVNLNTDQPFYDYLKGTWQATAFAGQSTFASFAGFWDQALHDGVVKAGNGGSVASATVSGIGNAASLLAKPSASEMEITFYETVNLGNGQFANNPWLMEMPDPVMRTVWGNHLAIPVNFDGYETFVGLKDLKDGDLVDLTVNGNTMTVPVVQQFGQMDGTLALALGYGRENAGFAASGTGVNVNGCLGESGGYTDYIVSNVSISEKIGEDKDHASVQYHHTMGVRDIDKVTGEEFNADEAALAPGYGSVPLLKDIRGFQGSLVERSVIFKSNLSVLADSVDDLHHKREEFEHLNQQTLYPFEEYQADKYKEGHHWGMHVDLNACTGCGACTVACMAENNVPVVGKTQVKRHQEMTWLRIDRYFYGDANNPNTVYQPMMCQHCDNAPCENVCPVNATNHSSEGLNQMTYNRCVGTRYCANNCPFKVRRFNWLDYTTADIFPANQPTVNGEEIPYGADDLTRMVLNPDVTVRTRGVIEKCSFCVQRIQEGKLTAKKEKRALRDADVKSACMTACPTGAITFGDQNNKKGELYKVNQSPLNYIVLEEINVRPSVQYTMKVNNRDESLDA